MCMFYILGFCTRYWSKQEFSCFGHLKTIAVYHYRSYLLYNLFCPNNPRAQETHIHPFINESLSCSKLHKIWNLLSFWNSVLFTLKHTNTNILEMYHTLRNHLLCHWLTHTNDPSKGQSVLPWKVSSTGSYSTNEDTEIQGGVFRRRIANGRQTAALPVPGVGAAFWWWRYSLGRWSSCLTLSLGQGELLATEVEASLELVYSSQIQPQGWSPSRSLGASRFPSRFWMTRWS